MNAGWYFTAPWDPISIRRGDALGLRAGADYFADQIAPDLSNGTSDARWITLLSWCLKWSHTAWFNAGGGDLARRDDQRARYAWMRPLELLWVDRTLESGQTTGQLRGRRSIERWRSTDRKLPNLGMSPEQFQRYRQVGMYGAYRVVFRKVEGLTTGDGWTPSATALKLANLVAQKLPRETQLTEEFFERGRRWGRWRDQEARFWTDHGWPEWRTKADRGLLPTSDDAVRKPLTKEECNILEPALFGAGSIRRATVEALAGAKGLKSHADLCDALVRSVALRQMLEPASLEPLPAFTRFADAAMHAMRGLWQDINQDSEKQAPAIEKLAKSADLRTRFGKLKQSGERWLRAPGRNTFPHDLVATQLAETIRQAKTLSEMIRGLTKHHHEYGGGRRWFYEQSGKLVPLVADTGIAASDYRFRLRSLCLLAAQCGVADMNSALDVLKPNDVDDDDGAE